MLDGDTASDELHALLWHRLQEPLTRLIDCRDFIEIDDAFQVVVSSSLIRHHNGYFVGGPATAADAYVLAWIFLIAVYDRIFKNASRSTNSTSNSSPGTHCDP
jgi:hypothetical protein